MMRHYELTQHDMEICSRQNQKNGWSFSPTALLYQLEKHRRAWENVRSYSNIPRYEKIVYGGERDMAMVEERLTDANFHSFCRMLHNHEYKEARKALKEGDY